MASDDLDTLARLRGLLDVSRVVRDDESLPEVLNAIAGTIADSLGYKVVVVNLYRPAWDDFEVTTVRDYNQEAVEQLLGTRGGWNAGRRCWTTGSSAAASTSCRPGSTTGRTTCSRSPRTSRSATIPTTGTPRMRCSCR